jgi:16S rRNA (guanine527-N7)-methyltransferase
MKTTLLHGLSELGIGLTDSQVNDLLAYLALIQKWTKVYNLTAVRDPAEMMTHHLLDSLAVIEPLRVQLKTVVQDDLVARFAGADLPAMAESRPQTMPQKIRLLDVGSGAGLPGVVIAICCPDITVHCVDTVAKKAAFIQQVAVTLKLTNLRGIHARVENLTDKYQVISSRAFASLLDFTHWSSKALADHGIWMAMKGKHPADEMTVLPADVKVFHVEQLNVPGLNADRCVLWLRQAAMT